MCSQTVCMTVVQNINITCLLCSVQTLGNCKHAVYTISILDIHGGVQDNLHISMSCAQTTACQ